MLHLCLLREDTVGHSQRLVGEQDGPAHVDCAVRAVKDFDAVQSEDGPHAPQRVAVHIAADVVEDNLWQLRNEL